MSEKRSIVEDDGLIGADVFSRFLVTLDLPNEKLLLSELPKRPDESESKTVSLDTGDPDDPATGPEDRESEQQSTPDTNGKAAATNSAAQSTGP